MFPISLGPIWSQGSNTRSIYRRKGKHSFVCLMQYVKRETIHRSVYNNIVQGKLRSNCDYSFWDFEFYKLYWLFSVFLAINIGWNSKKKNKESLKVWNSLKFRTDVLPFHFELLFSEQF